MREMSDSWDNLKSKARKQFTEVKREQRRTSEGPPPKPQDPLNDKVVTVIGDEINPLGNPFDDDAEFNNEIEGKWSRSSGVGGKLGLGGGGRSHEAPPWLARREKLFKMWSL